MQDSSSPSGPAARFVIGQSGGRLSALAVELDAIGRSWDRRLAAIKQIAEASE